MHSVSITSQKFLMFNLSKCYAPASRRVRSCCTLIRTSTPTDANVAIAFQCTVSKSVCSNLFVLICFCSHLRACSPDPRRLRCDQGSTSTMHHPRHSRGTRRRAWAQEEEGTARPAHRRHPRITSLTPRRSSRDAAPGAAAAPAPGPGRGRSSLAGRTARTAADAAAPAAATPPRLATRAAQVRRLSLLPFIHLSLHSFFHCFHCSFFVFCSSLCVEKRWRDLFSLKPTPDLMKRAPAAEESSHITSFVRISLFTFRSDTN